MVEKVAMLLSKLGVPKEVVDKVAEFIGKTLSKTDASAVANTDVQSSDASKDGTCSDCGKPGSECECPDETKAEGGVEEPGESGDAGGKIAVVVVSKNDKAKKLSDPNL